VLAALLALAGAASWGVGDFLGGLSARKASVLTVLFGSQLVGFVGAGAWVAVSGDPWPGLGDAAPGLGAGVAGAVGLAALYRGLAVGAMGIVAPISAASPIVPLSVDLAHGITPSALQCCGIAVILGGIVVLSRAPSATRRAGLAAGVLLALLAALGFGLFVVGVDAAADASVAWTVALARGASTTLALTAVLAAGAAVVPERRSWPTIAGVGVFDTGANVLVAEATTHGSAGIVAVLGSLYPVMTIALAFAVLGERLDRSRRGAGLAALAGAALVAAG
jgi:drug/metabolite transporter (DMT)-like permease